MVGSISRRFGRFLPVLVLAAVFAGCAATTGGIEDIQSPEGATAWKTPEERLAVESVSVVDNGDRVLIASNGPVKYTVFNLVDPPRLVVDMKDVDISGVTFPIKVDNDYVKDIDTSSLPGEGKNSVSRVVIGIKDGIQHEVEGVEAGILVALKKGPLSGAEALEKSGVEAAGPRDAERPSEKAEASAPAQAPQETAPLKPATEVKDIEVSNLEGGSVISIAANGEISRHSFFELKNPSRIVVDVWGVKNSTGKDRMNFKDSLIKSIRIGSHPDKTRFVFDTGASVPPYLVTKTGGYIVMTVGTSARPNRAPVNDSQALSSRKSDGRVLVALQEDPSGGKTSTNGVSKPILPGPAPLEEATSAATVVKEVEFISFEGGSVVNIVTDGEVTKHSSFELEDPSRIVLDVWGVKNSTGKDRIKVKDSVIKSVRIGSHPDKTRFVFETGGKVPGYLVTKTENYIVMTVGISLPAGTSAENTEEVVAEEASSGVASTKTSPAGVGQAVSSPGQAPQERVEVALADPAPLGEKGEEAARPKTSAVESSAPATQGVEAAPLAAMVQGAVPPVAQAPVTAVKEPAPLEEKKEYPRIERIDFRKIADKGVLTIEKPSSSSYAVKESKEGKTLIIGIKDAALPEELRRTLDATKLKTPVLSISSYQVQPGEVRVLVELSAKADYDVKEMDGTVTVSFASPKVPLPEAADGKAYTGRRIDLDMVDANVTDILRLLAEVSDLNIIASDDVTGTISLRLKNVPWDQAFDIILKAKNLGSIRDGNVVRVAPAAKIRQEEEAALAAKKAQEKLEDTEIRFVPVNYAKAEDLEGQVKGVLSERGSVSTDARTNTLIIKDIRSGIEIAEGLVKRLDTPIPQVLIEARIVEAETSFARDLGIQWGIDYQTTGNLSTDTFGSTGTSGQTPPSSTDFPPFETHHGADRFAVNLPATGTAGPLGALGFVLGKTGQNPLVLDLRLSAGEQEGRLRTISRPKIVTMDNREAKIEQGESIPFETTSAAGTMTTFVDANLSLTVTPHITPDGSILMRIKASRNSVGTFRTATGEPSINKKEASTEVLVRDGETTVIGGIVISDNSETDKGIPYLKDIPLLGALFKSKSVSDSQEELLIFITPTIIKEKAARDNAMR